MAQLESLRYLPLSWLIGNLTTSTVCQQQILSGKVFKMINKLAISGKLNKKQNLLRISSKCLWENSEENKHIIAVNSGDVLTRNQILLRIVQAESKEI